MKIDWVLATALIVALLCLFFQSSKMEAQMGGAWQVVSGSGDGVGWTYEDGMAMYLAHIKGEKRAARRYIFNL